MLDQLRGHGLAGGDVEQGDVAGAHQPPQDLVADLADPVAHHHRASRQGQLRRHRAAAGQGDGRGGHGVEFQAIVFNDVNRRRPGGHLGLDRVGHRRRGRQHHPQPRPPGVQQGHGRRKGRHHPADLGRTAAGQHQQDRIVRLRANGGAQPRGIGHRGVTGQRRGADEGRRQALALEMRNVEGVNGQQMVHRPGQHLGPARPRGPDLGRDVFDDRQVRVDLAQAVGDPQGEAPGVDQHGDVRFLAAGQLGGLGHPRHDLAVGHQPLEQAQDRQLADVERADDPLLRHPHAAHADKPHIGRAQASLQRAGEACPQGVAGGLGRDQHDADRPGHVATRSGGRPTMNRPRSSAISITRSRSTTSSPPASPTTPASPAWAAAITVAGPMVGRSIRRS